MTLHETRQELALLKQDFEATLTLKNTEIIDLQHQLNRANIKIVPLFSISLEHSK